MLDAYSLGTMHSRPSQDTSVVAAPRVTDVRPVLIRCSRKARGLSFWKLKTFENIELLWKHMQESRNSKRSDLCHICFSNVRLDHDSFSLMCYTYYASFSEEMRNYHSHRGVRDVMLLSHGTHLENAKKGPRSACVRTGTYGTIDLAKQVLGVRYNELHTGQYRYVL
jgi:hypothetical protein